MCFTGFLWKLGKLHKKHPDMPSFLKQKNVLPWIFWRKETNQKILFNENWIKTNVVYHFTVHTNNGHVVTL